MHNFTRFLCHNRWNSSLDMIESILDQRTALVGTFDALGDDAPVEFTNTEWTTMGKVKRVLKPFKEATEILSHRDASISMAIPVVTTIMAGLEEESTDDRGVLGMKRDLTKYMRERFSNMEEKDYYSASTLLDAKFKKNMFRNPDTLERTKTLLVDKIVEALQTASQVTNHRKMCVIVGVMSAMSHVAYWRCQPDGLATSLTVLL